MSDSGASSSDLSELQEGVGLRSDTGSNDSAEDSEPETEAETERLEISPQKARDGVVAPEVADEEPDEAATPDVEADPHSMRPGLTAQDILQGDRPSSDAEDDDEHTPTAAAGRSHVRSPPEVAGKKRKRSGSALANGLAAEGEPLKKRSSSTRFDRKSNEATKGALASLRDRNEEAIADSSSADEARELAEATTDGSPRKRAVIDVDLDGEKDDQADLSETAGDDDATLNEPMDEEDPEADGDADGDEAEAEAEAEATAKTEDECMQTVASSYTTFVYIDTQAVAKKRVAMDALVPIEKLFAVFRDRLFDERWAQLSDELALLNDPNTTHPDYLAMRLAIDARRVEKINLEHVTLGYKTRALESKVLSHRAQIHGQYFQTVRKIREQYMETLNEQFSRIQRERRQWKTKEPHFVYNFDPKRSKQIAYQTAYNKEVSLLSGIAKHVGFPGAPEIHGASSTDIEDDLRAMNIKPHSRPLSYSARMASSVRADEAAAEEQFLEKTPWANPQHPVHQQTLGLDRKSLDPSRAPIATPSNRIVDMQRGIGASGSTIGANSDPPSGFAPSHADTIVNGSSPFEQMKRREAPNAPPQQLPNSNGDGDGDKTASTQNAPAASSAPEKSTLPLKSPNAIADSFPPRQPFENMAAPSSQPSETLTNNPSVGPKQSSDFGASGPEPQEQQASSTAEQESSAAEPDRYQTHSVGAAAVAPTDRRFEPSPATHEPMAANVGVARSFGVR